MKKKKISSNKDYKQTILYIIYARVRAIWTKKKLFQNWNQFNFHWTFFVLTQKKSSVYWWLVDAHHSSMVTYNQLPRILLYFLVIIVVFVVVCYCCIKNKSRSKNIVTDFYQFVLQKNKNRLLKLLHYLLNLSHK